jgi:hypothetical protein
MKSPKTQKLPPSGPEREALREKGQFWTPPWVAEAMVSYVVAGRACDIFDPAVGAGAFFQAAKACRHESGRKLTLRGTEIDCGALNEALRLGLTAEDLRGVELRDFVLDPPPRRFAAIVANPPYIRHHRLPAEVKERLRLFCRGLLSFQLDGRAGYHVYFLLRALDRLERGGRLAFIMPADTCEGVFSQGLWSWITNRFRLDAVVTFAPDASPFPGVDTNAVIFMIRNAAPADTVIWAQCQRHGTAELLRWVRSDFGRATADLSVHRRPLSELLRTGLSRAPIASQQVHRITLGTVATVLRGIATGANEFFFLTRRRASELGIPDEYLVRAIGRTRDVESDVLTLADVEDLDTRGRPTRLLSLGGNPVGSFPLPLQEYLRRGEEQGLPCRPLIATRRPWYKMEVRAVPAFLFAYLGRRNTRFVRNMAGVVPLTGFLCVYPRDSDPGFWEQLWKVLNHPDTLANLRIVGKSYGSGAIKVEPRALERLPLPESALAEVGLGRLFDRVQVSLPFEGPLVLHPARS